MGRRPPLSRSGINGKTSRIAVGYLGKLEKMYYTYILKSEKDYKYYIGQTNNVKLRLIRHNKGTVKSTKNRIPFKFIFAEKFDTRAEAIRREKYLKSLKGGQTWKNLLVKWGVAKW